MAEYPYATVVSKIPLLFDKIKSTGQPRKINFSWLKSIGFKSSNDQRLVPLLKAINFVDNNGVPTERWLKFRADNKVLAEGIMEGYKELFDVYPDAYNRSKEDLFNFFSTKTTAGNQVINKMVGTFLELCKIADFSNITSSDIVHDTPSLSKTEKKVSEKVLQRKQLGNLEHGITININIQLTVPETTDDEIYDKFFEALKKHLLTN